MNRLFTKAIRTTSTSPMRGSAPVVPMDADDHYFWKHRAQHASRVRSRKEAARLRKENFNGN